MPKSKTKKAAAKRFVRSGSGKLKHGHAGRGHLLSAKSQKRKRHLRRRNVLSATEQKRLKHMLGS